jgi:hypothetical protein
MSPEMNSVMGSRWPASGSPKAEQSRPGSRRLWSARSGQAGTPEAVRDAVRQVNRPEVTGTAQVGWSADDDSFFPLASVCGLRPIIATPEQRTEARGVFHPMPATRLRTRGYAIPQLAHMTSDHSRYHSPAAQRRTAATYALRIANKRSVAGEGQIDRSNRNAGGTRRRPVSSDLVLRHAVACARTSADFLDEIGSSRDRCPQVSALGSTDGAGDKGAQITQHGPQQACLCHT